MAPALLSYIPRYLGVMLVNYRKPQPASVAAATPSEANAIGPQRQGMKRAASFAGTNGTDTKPAESKEVPEVALMYNKHVVPDWLFRRGGRI